MTFGMMTSWLWPALLGLVFVANGAEALIRRRFFLFARRDPAAAIYRQHQAAFYWLLIGTDFALAAGLCMAAYFQYRG
jgi:hypothetical protein